jgi:hypothetical protein
MIIQSLKCFLHWLYNHHLNLRPILRSIMGKSAISVCLDNKKKNNKDGGKTRAHVLHFLQVTKSDLRFSLSDFLFDIISLY